MSSGTWYVKFNTGSISDAHDVKDILKGMPDVQLMDLRMYLDNNTDGTDGIQITSGDDIDYDSDWPRRLNQLLFHIANTHKTSISGFMILFPEDQDYTPQRAEFDNNAKHLKFIGGISAVDYTYDELVEIHNYADKLVQKRKEN